VTITVTISVASFLSGLWNLIQRTVMNTIDTISYVLWSAVLLGRPLGRACDTRDRAVGVTLVFRKS
jgi:hypothetical protein